LFCKILAGEIPADVVYENATVLAFRDIAPQAPTHVLVIPRQHIDHAGVVDADDAETVVSMLLAAQEVARLEGIDGPDRGYRLIMNVGPDALNSVPHLHLHVLGGRTLSWPPG
jgi:histidine triad (HIT) family protein